MERAKKMVLISTENLERMQRQLQHQQQNQYPSTNDNEPMENSRNSENTEIANNTVQTPGTPLSRLDAEMNRILNSPLPNDEAERWKLYKEVLWRSSLCPCSPKTKSRGRAQRGRGGGRRKRGGSAECGRYRRRVDTRTSSFSSPLNSTQIEVHPRERNLESTTMMMMMTKSVPKSYYLKNTGKRTEIISRPSTFNN